MNNRDELDRLLRDNSDIKFNSKNFDGLTDKHQKRILKMLQNDAIKNKGGYTFNPGFQTNYSGAPNVTGYGNNMKAFANHLGGFSAGEAYANAFGIMTPSQKAMMANSSTLGKLMYKSIPAFGAYSAAAAAFTGEDPFEYAGEQFAVGAAVSGYRMGSLFGKSMLGRFAGGVAGGGILAGAVYGGFAAAGDLSSNESKIAHAAKKVYTKEVTADMFENNKTLTARQAALSKLSNSAINDRGLLLGNEAMVLRGAM